MAQIGFTPIQLYFSSTTTNVPLAANLANGELAINITDGKLFYKDNASAVQVIGWKVVPATAGGTGQTSYAVGDLLYADTTTTLAKLPDVATGNALISGGVGVAPSYGKIGLTTHVSGTLPVTNGGTGTATAFTTGSVVFAGASGVYSQDNANIFWDDTNNRLGLGTASPTKMLNVVIGAVAGRQNLDSVSRTSQNLLTVTNPEYSTDASMGIMFRSFPQSDARQGAGIFASGGSGNNVTDLNLFVSGLGGADTTYSAVNIEGVGGDVTVRKGNLVVGTSGKGIDFSATAGTGTSELLADYEEGTWTPSLTGSTSGSATSGGNTYGNYTKVGRLVTLNFTMTISSVNTLTGNVKLSGLPFNLAAGGAFENRYPQGATIFASLNTLWASVVIGSDGGTTTLAFTGTKIPATGTTNVTAADLTATSFFAGSIQYIA